MNTTFRHWHITTDEDNIVWLSLDYADGRTNILTQEVLSEFKTIILEYQKQTPKGLIIRSAKSSGFVAGANIQEFLQLKNPTDAFNMLRHVQEIYEILAKLTCPTLALINGFCLGGGLEMALACRYRIALDDPKTRLGFPEILLGIHPGWGGSVRAPLLLGAPKALDLILTGRNVSTFAAKKMGLVDAVVPQRQFERAAKYYILHQPTVKQARGLTGLTNATFIRPILAYFVRKQLKAKANPEHYPAPYAMLNFWEKTGPHSADAFVKEAESVSSLVDQPTAENLIRDFFLRENLKKLAQSKAEIGKHVHVIGSGTMGGDIAAWCALKGFNVTVQDTNLEVIAKARQRANDLLTKHFHLQRERNTVLDRLIPDVNGLGMKSADIIIEAIPEILELKQTVWREIEAKAKPSALLATNTSSLPLLEIAESLKKPERLIGIHFFNPVAVLQLVEVVSTEKTDENLRQLAMLFVKKIDRLPLPVRSSPGFLVNRILTPYLLEAAMMLDEGIPAKVIDKAATDFGMPLGPIAIADMVGLDVCLAVADHMAAVFNLKVPEALRQKVVKGELGKKTGKGFYEYKKGKLQAPHVTGAHQAYDEKTIMQRLILRFLNESVACLREHIVIHSPNVSDSDLIDAGMIFGAGFAPFRGGPIHYIESEGVQVLLQQLKDLQAKFGERFTPDAGWEMLEK